MKCITSYLGPQKSHKKSGGLTEMSAQVRRVAKVSFNQPTQGPRTPRVQVKEQLLKTGDMRVNIRVIDVFHDLLWNEFHYVAARYEYRTVCAESSLGVIAVDKSPHSPRRMIGRGSIRQFSL